MCFSVDTRTESYTIIFRISEKADNFGKLAPEIFQVMRCDQIVRERENVKHQLLETVRGK